MGEIELAYRVAKGRLIGITGTNGKTTTTALTGEIMKIILKRYLWLVILNSIYKYCIRYNRGQCDCCRNQQFPA